MPASGASASSFGLIFLFPSFGLSGTKKALDNVNFDQQSEQNQDWRRANHGWVAVARCEQVLILHFPARWRYCGPPVALWKELVYRERLRSKHN
jgi:hypothetical protein